MFPYTRHHPPTITLFPYTTLFRSPEYMIKDIPPTGTIDIEKPQIYFGEAEFPNVIANSKVDEFDYPAGQENMSTRFDADAGIPMTRLNRLLFVISEGSFRMLV